MSNELLDVTVRNKDQRIEFEELIEESGFYYESYNKEFNSYSFPVDGEYDANALEKALTELFCSTSVSMEFEFVEG